MKRATALILALILLLSFSACGTPAAENNTADTNIADNTNEAAPEPEPEPEPEPPKPVYTNPLTGEETEEDISGLRPVGLMMNNISVAMPQHGNSDADILIEITVEGNITRMIGFFQQITSKTEKIGSIRSARPHYLDWVETFDGIYMSASGSKATLNYIKSRGTTYVNLLGSCANISYRDEDRKAAGYAFEHTLFSTGKRFEEGLPKLGIELKHKDGFDNGLRFTDTAQTASGTPANKVKVEVNSSKNTYFDYDAASKKYLISEHGDKYIDGNTKEQVGVKNVLVLYAKDWHDYSSSGFDKGTSSGSGAYLCEGKMIDIKWTRGADGFRLMKTDGSELPLAVGHTFICCAQGTGGKVSAE